MTEATTTIAPLRWRSGLELLDQRALPSKQRWLRVRSSSEGRRCIQQLAVRGAPAIGLAAAYTLAVEARRNPRLGNLRTAARRLATARPTATNLARAVAEVMKALEASDIEVRGEVALSCARSLHAADAAACLAIGAHGAALFAGDSLALLTICNAGALATGGIGTALGIVRVLHAQGRLARVYVCETRPVLQGARLTAWELVTDGIPVTVLPDGAAAGLLASGTIGGVVVGADRIAADGAVANKVGTHALALAAAHYGVRFVVAAPTTTYDLGCPDGAAIPIEQRAASEVEVINGRRITPAGAAAYNPAFDITPAALITAIVSERGVAMPVGAAAIREIAR